MTARARGRAPHDPRLSYDVVRNPPVAEQAIADRHPLVARLTLTGDADIPISQRAGYDDAPTGCIRSIAAERCRRTIAVLG